MVIFSQDEEEIVNFNSADSVWVCSDEEGIFTIEATADTNTTLGCYKTKKRAKEVLAEIISAYSTFENIKYTNMGSLIPQKALKDIAKNIQLFDVYQMPSE